MAKAHRGDASVLSVVAFYSICCDKGHRVMLRSSGEQPGMAAFYPFDILFSLKAARYRFWLNGYKIFFVCFEREMAAILRVARSESGRRVVRG